METTNGNGVEFLTAKEVAEITKYSLSMAGEIIRRLNKELERKGYITFKGRVLRSYFSMRVGGRIGKEETLP